MKKLMMAVAIVCAAAVSQAATVSWSTDWLVGSNGEAMYMQEEGVTYTASILFSPSGSTTLEDDGFGAYNGTGDSFSYDVGTYTATLTITEYKDGAVNATLTGSGTFTLLGEADKPAETVLGFSDGQGFSNFAGFGDGDGKWQTVPEPTSGLLLLIGVAGLALRRRRA